MQEIFRAHFARYPLMKAQDAVKLCYQSEFGGGHMIRDVQGCLDYLRREYRSVEKREDTPLYEEIGNGAVRVNLAAVGEEDLEKLGRWFIESAENWGGRMDSFLGKLEVLKELTDQGIFGFDRQELEVYLQEYEKAGYPPVSHGQGYRQMYGPAYRVVAKAWLE
jgi:hypothetical protein